MSSAARANDIANTLLGTGVGIDPPLGNSADRQYVRAQYVRRDSGEVIVVMAVALNNTLGSQQAFGLADVAGGAALASYLDRTVVQCERSVVTRGKVDFLFVVDDSGSMSGSQSKLGVAATAMVDALNNSTLDWRVALVTSSYHTTSSGNTGIVRGFTTNLQLFRAWLQSDVSPAPTPVTSCRRDWTGETNLSCGTSGTGTNSGRWIGTNGNSAEGMLGAARLALLDMNHPNAPNSVSFRDDADIVVIILSDAEDQTSGMYASNGTQSSWENIQNFVEFFQGETTTNNVPGYAPGRLSPIRPGVPIRVNAIYCPSNGSCGDDRVPNYPDGITRIQRVVRATGGYESSIMNTNAISGTIEAIVDSAIGKGGVKTQKPLIGASLRVAIENPSGVCKTNPDNPNEVSGSNVPRSRQHGFDYDGIAQTVTLFGNCRPEAGLENPSRVAISYRAWEASNRLPCENDVRFVNDEAQGYCTGRFTCDTDQDVCVCPAVCGGCPDITPICDEKSCMCYPQIN
jgi:hypothetical protein